MHDVIEGDGFAVANVDALGDQYGFRKIRRGLGVTAMGMNAIALPPGFSVRRRLAMYRTRSAGSVRK